MDVRIGFARTLIAVSLLLAGCGGGGGSSGGTDPGPGATAVPAFRASPVAQASCAAHRISLQSGLDRNGNGQLDDGEVQQTELLCESDSSAHGLVQFTLLAAGDACALGGVNLRAGEDSNGNQVLDAAEIAYDDNVCETLSTATLLSADFNAPLDATYSGALPYSGSPGVTFELIQPPASGQLLLSGDGSFSYQPEPSYVGQTSFSYRLSHGGQSVLVSATINVTAMVFEPQQLPDMVLEQNQRAEQNLTLRNLSSVPLSYTLALEDSTSQGASAKAGYGRPDYLVVKKGESDPRSSYIGVQGAGGQDDFGYRWKDSNEVNGPSFDWIDISTTGTLVTGLYDDSVSPALPIGFEFSFYGQGYSELYVSSNGFLHFGSQPGDSGCCSGQPIPGSDPVNNTIAWLWRDLHPQLGQVYYQTLDDNRFVIQFANYGEYGGPGTVDAQIILHRSGDIVLQYLNLRDGIETRAASIGIENADGSDGLQVAFGSNYLQAGLAVQIWSGPQWLDLDSNAATLQPGEARDLALTYQASEELGRHSANLVVFSDHPAQPSLSMSLALQINEDATPPAPVTDLSASTDTYDQATLQWTAPADAAYWSKPVSAYEIRYDRQPIDEQRWAAATPVSVNLLPASPGQLETVQVTGLDQQTRYYFAVRSRDTNGNSSGISANASVNTVQAPELALPTPSIRVELVEGSQATATLNLTNTGGSSLQLSAGLVELDAVALSPKPMTTAVASIQTAWQPLAALPSQGSFVPDELIVGYYAKPDQQASQDLLAQHNARLLRRMDALQMEVWQLTAQDQLLQTVQALAADPNIRFAEPNYRLKHNALPDDSRFSELWGLHNTGATGGTVDADIDAPEAWELSLGSRDVVVAIIDTGIDYSHSDLAANIWVNSGEIPGNGIDDDGNGFVDDVHGYDFVNRDGDPMDDNNHGTHVAGTIGAEGNNAAGVVGVNHQVSLMAVKFLSSFGSGNLDDAISSILYAVDNGATVLNNSWGGGGYSEALKSAIEYAGDHDVLFVAAAGNAGYDNDLSPSYPASYEVDNVLAVAATDHNDQLAGFSQFGRLSVDLGAPGVNVLSTVVGGAYESFNGTSMATPHVAGAAGLLKAYNPSLTALQMKQLLMDSVDPVAALADRSVSGGRLNLHQAMLLSGPHWVRLLSPASAQVAPGAQLTLEFAFNATDLSPGEYRVDLVLTSNDPLQPEVTVPVTLVVQPDLLAPSTIVDLSVVAVGDRWASLQFTAPGDDADQGRASHYELRYSSTELTEANWDAATPVSGLPLPAAAGSAEQFSVSGLTAAAELWLGIRAIDNVGLQSGISNLVNLTTLLADLRVSPASPPELTLASGTSGDFDLLLENIGTADLSVQLSVGTPATAGAMSTQGFASAPTAKGEIDRRRGNPVLQSSGGPDEFGYRWRDSNEVNGPQYQWQDISATGTLLTGFADDNLVGPVDIGFNFPFYGENQTQLYLSSNGFISFTAPSSSGCCAGQPLPAQDLLNHLIAWLWYDLHPKSGSVHYQLVAPDKLVIQFTGYGEYSSVGSVDAQVILYRDGTIDLQYNSFRDGMHHTWASVGIENSDGTDGLQVAFNTDYLSDALLVRIQPGWLSLGVSSAELVPTASAVVPVQVDASALAAGRYESEIVILSNDLDEPEMRLPVVLNVTD